MNSSKNLSHPAPTLPQPPGPVTAVSHQALQVPGHMTNLYALLSSQGQQYFGALVGLLVTASQLSSPYAVQCLSKTIIIWSFYPPA